MVEELKVKETLKEQRWGKEQGHNLLPDIRF